MSLLIGIFILFRRAPSSQPNQLPKTSSPKTIMLRNCVIQVLSVYSKTYIPSKSSVNADICEYQSVCLTSLFSPSLKLPELHFNYIPTQILTSTSNCTYSTWNSSASLTNQLFFLLTSPFYELHISSNSESKFSYLSFSLAILHLKQLPDYIRYHTSLQLSPFSMLTFK